MSAPPFNLDALVQWFEENKEALEALKERSTKAQSSKDDFPTYGWDDAGSPSDVRDNTISDLGSETPRSTSRSPSPAQTWNPDVDIQTVVDIDRIRIEVAQLDPDMLGYLAECGVIVSRIANSDWFSFYVNATSSKPLKLPGSASSRDKMHSDCAILCISAQTYVTLVQNQLLHYEYMPLCNKRLAEIMHARLEKTHSEIPSCLQGFSNPEFSSNTFFEFHEHDFSSIRHRKVPVDHSKVPVDYSDSW